MKLNKSPEIDGLSVEFYQTFWHTLDYLVVDSLNEAYDETKVNYPLCKSKVSLVYKK